MRTCSWKCTNGSRRDWRAEIRETLADWDPVKRTIAFYEREKEAEKEAAAVGVLTDDYDSSYEAINLMARHNIPFRVLHS